ncbi:hypothetical protein [Flavobacterium daemonense]|uniref:hypothetical protein n=1 Tax=Flavobacterium daemonense TaxID=1393049 RepID=UPI001185803E|nr:hypothetical protein [Flavobacterium daemonense]KAF2336159.1 hypothetical protein FND99_02430 [Flavobacterium daemonense]
MVDRIKIKISKFTVVNDYPLWGNYRPSKFPNRHIFSREISNEKAKVKRPFEITLMLYYDDEKDKFTIGFNGSIRKWYFGKNTRRNLTPTQLKDCIKLLSVKIGIREQDLLNARVTQLESGVTLLLKSDFKEVINCFARHRTFSREVDGTTVYFKGKKTKEGKDSIYKYKFYEKYLEINKNDKNFRENPIKMNVHKKFLFFRFEIVIKKVSGMDFYKTKAKTLNNIIINWEEINLELINRFQAIQFIDLISDEKIIDSTKLGKRDSEKYLNFQRIRKNGFLRELEKFELTNTSTNRTTKTKAFFKNYEMFLDKKIDYKNELYQALKRKIDSLV